MNTSKLHVKKSILVIHIIILNLFILFRCVEKNYFVFLLTSSSVSRLYYRSIGIMCGKNKCNPSSENSIYIKKIYIKNFQRKLANRLSNSKSDVITESIFKCVSGGKWAVYRGNGSQVNVLYWSVIYSFYSVFRNSVSSQTKTNKSKEKCKLSPKRCSKNCCRDEKSKKICRYVYKLLFYDSQFLSSEIDGFSSLYMVSWNIYLDFKVVLLFSISEQYVGSHKWFRNVKVDLPFSTRDVLSCHTMYSFVPKHIFKIMRV